MATVAAAGLRLIGAARRPAALARALSAGTVIVSTATTGNTMAQASGNLPGRPIGGGVRELSWDDLMPPDWDPMKLLSGKDLDSINDGDPRSERIMREIREQWDQAPTRSDLEGLKIRLPGYVVPLDMLGGELREFLLVPYLGACIHTPPPPANQIIQVRSTRKRALQTMDAIWVTGTLRIARSDTKMGISGYILEATAIEPYRGSQR